MDYLLVHFRTYGDVYQESDAGRITRYMAPDGTFLFSDPPPGENYVHVDNTPARLDWMPELAPTDLYYGDHVKAQEYAALDPKYKLGGVTSELSAAKVLLYQNIRDAHRLQENPEVALAKLEETRPDDVAAALEDK